jgi:hypothetical protein
MQDYPFSARGKLGEQVGDEGHFAGCLSTRRPGTGSTCNEAPRPSKAAGRQDHLLQNVRSRGPLSTELKTRLISDPIPLPELRSLAHSVAAAADDTLIDEDVQLGLWILYELHYRGFSDVAERWE